MMTAVRLLAAALGIGAAVFGGLNVWDEYAEFRGARDASVCVTAAQTGCIRETHGKVVDRERHVQRDPPQPIQPPIPNPPPPLPPMGPYRMLPLASTVQAAAADSVTYDVRIRFTDGTVREFGVPHSVYQVALPGTPAIVGRWNGDLAYVKVAAERKTYGSTPAYLGWWLLAWTGTVLAAAVAFPTYDFGFAAGPGAWIVGTIAFLIVADWPPAAPLIPLLGVAWLFARSRFA